LAESRIDQLEAELRDTIGRRDELERARLDIGNRFGAVGEQVQRIEAALKEIGDAVRAIGEATRQSR
jgi:hypothetical protein